MIQIKRFVFLFILSLIAEYSSAQANTSSGEYWVVDYPASTAAGELQIAVTYKLWIPGGVKKIRAVIVHQHGAGTIAANAGRTASEDLQWQELARKWDCALLGPSYHVLNDRIDDSTGGSELWFDPRRGSDRTFLRALNELGILSGHKELTWAPWCLWGHSGGGIWADMMSTLYPDRVIAMWLRSGTAFMFRSKPEFKQLDSIPHRVYSIPIMCNPGIKEKNNLVGKGTLATFHEYRAEGALIGFAEDPLSGHDCGYSRSLAIPFFDACLAMRLPDKNSEDQSLRPMDISKAWLASLTDKKVYPFAAYKGNPLEAVWLPDETVAKAWMEYVKNGAVSDTTPPPAPFNVTVTNLKNSGTTISWSARADLESGIGGFIVMRDGKELIKLPVKPKVIYGHPLFQFGPINYFHDTPEYPVPLMSYTDIDAKVGEKHTYEIIAVNSDGLVSKPSKAEND